MNKLQPHFGIGKILSAFIREEEGQSTTEYILILAVVVMIALKFKTQVGSLISGRIGKLTTDLNQFDSVD